MAQRYYPGIMAVQGSEQATTPGFSRNLILAGERNADLWLSVDWF